MRLGRWGMRATLQRLAQNWPLKLQEELSIEQN